MKLFLLLFPFFYIVCSPKCNSLSDGSYQVQHDPQFSDYKDYELNINGNTITESNIETKGKIIWLDDNEFKISRVGERDSLTELQKQILSLGEPYYEITDCKEDTVYFTFRQNLHVIIRSGKIIRKKK